MRDTPGTSESSDIVFVLIGAGSTVFTPGLLLDLALSPFSDRYDVRLVDLNADAAETMAQLGNRVAKAARSQMRVSATTDRRRALTGATFVVVTIAVGSAAGWRADLDVPAPHGGRQTGGGSLGPGGGLRGPRPAPRPGAVAPGVGGVA